MIDVTHSFITPNSEDDNGPLWDPWEAIHIPSGGYSGQVDIDAIKILRAIRDGVLSGRSGGEYGNYSTKIAKSTGLSDHHVELWQYIFCSAGWCDYGTSPRGCFPDLEIDFDGLIAAWESYYERHWGQKWDAP